MSSAAGRPATAAIVSLSDRCSRAKSSSIWSSSSTADGSISRHAASASRAAASDANCGTRSPRCFGRGTNDNSASATTPSVPSEPTSSGTSEGRRKGPAASRTPARL